MRLSLWVLIFHRVDFSHFILLLSKYWILSIINQALSKTKELPEIESRYFASEEEFPSLLASRQLIKAVILTDVCRYRFYAILEMSRNVQSGNTQNLKSMVIQRSFPKWSVAERRKTAAASNQAAVCACAHSRYFAGGSPSGLRV